MTVLMLNLPDDTRHRLEVVAQARGISVAKLFEEMSTVLLAEADAETRFRLRAERGAGREAHGLALLRKSGGCASEGQGS
jgi:hypothetical protein